MSGHRAACVAALASTVLCAPAVLSAQQFSTQKFNIGGTGGTDYLAADPATGRVYVSRGTHVMVIDGVKGTVVGDIPDTPRVHGIAFAPREGHGFTTNAGDSTLTMFNLGDMSVIRKVHIGIDGADGIIFDESTNLILSINHSHPMGTAVAVNAKTGDVVGTITLSGMAPEGGASDGHGLVFINIEDHNSIDVVDLKSMKVTATWKIDPCDGPTGIIYDARTKRIVAGCSKKSVIVNPVTGKVVAVIKNGDGVDALGWDAAERLIYIPAGRDGNITVVHQESADRYKVIAKVQTVAGAKTIAVDESKHRAYVFAVEYGPTPAPVAGATPTASGRGPRGPIVGTWFVSITH